MSHKHLASRGENVRDDFQRRKYNRRDADTDADTFPGSNVYDAKHNYHQGEAFFH
jgi:hypothetical protein